MIEIVLRGIRLGLAAAALIGGAFVAIVLLARLVDWGEDRHAGLGIGLLILTVSLVGGVLYSIGLAGDR